MPSCLKRLSPVALSVLIATVGGLVGGTTAVHGLEQKPYGPIDPPALIARAQDEGAPPAGWRDASYAADDTARCAGCSERDLGYRWAVLAAVRSPDQCPGDSWGFRRGCLDYTGGI